MIATWLKSSASHILMICVVLPFWQQASCVQAEVRTWSDATGKFSIEAKLVRIDAETVRLKKSDGKEIDVPISKLSESDRAFIAGQLESKPADESDTEDSNAKPATDLPRISVKQLQDEAKADIEAFNSKWVGRTAEVEGLIGEFDRGERGRDRVSLVFLRESKDDVPGMACVGVDPAFRPWNKYQTGKVGIVRGKVGVNLFRAPVLEDAEFVWSENGGMPRMTTEELVAEFLADADSTQTKFNDKYYVFSGKVLRYAGDDRVRRLILQGKGDDNFEVHFASPEERYFSELETGVEIYFVGRCQFGGIYLNHEKVGAKMCERLPSPEEATE